MERLQPLKISRDGRRILTNLLKTDIKDINFYEASKGALLGNHLHKNTTEYFFITKGTCLVTSGDKREIVNRKNLFAIKPNTKHSIECLTDVAFLTFLSEPFDESAPDLHK